MWRRPHRKLPEADSAVGPDCKEAVMASSNDKAEQAKDEQTSSKDTGPEPGIKVEQLDEPTPDGTGELLTVTEDPADPMPDSVAREATRQAVENSTSAPTDGDGNALIDPGTTPPTVGTGPGEASHPIP
jgi:hypothetical protein